MDKWFALFLMIATGANVLIRFGIISKRPKTKVWRLKIYTVEGLEPHKVTVLDDEYNALKTWLRGEGDSLFELATDDAYLGLKRAHVVSVKGEKK